MRRVFYTIIFLFIWIFFFYEIYSVYFYINANSTAVLTTPYDNLMISLRPDLIYDFYYYHSYEINRIDKVDLSSWIFALSPIMASIIFFQLSYLFILLFTKIRKTENSFLVFASIISIQFILFFDFLTYHRWEILFYFFTLVSNVGFLYLFLSLLNRKLPNYIYLFSLVLIILITIYFFPLSAHEEILFFKILGITHLTTFIFALAAYMRNVFYPNLNFPAQKSRIQSIFALTSLSIILIPGLSYLIPIYYNIHISLFINLIFYIPALFPMILMIFSLHNNYFFFIKPVRTWYLRLVYFVFFIFLYALIVGFEGLLVLSGSGSLWLHIVSVLAFIFVFDALRLLSEITTNYYLNYRKYVFEEHITDIFQYMQTPFQFEDGIERFLKMIENGSGASKATLLLSHEMFGVWLRGKFNIKFIDDDNPIWEIQQNRFRFLKKNVISLNDHGVPELFLKVHSSVLIIFFRKFKVAIMLNEKNNKTPYLSEDLNYIEDLIVQTEPILENYKLLIDNIETKKFERELENVSLIQRKSRNAEIKKSLINVFMYNQPSKFVTGDYMEVFHISESHSLILLGDVSGHSLASAYFMGMVRSMIEGVTQSRKYTLQELFNFINIVLCDKQSVSSFMTLCAIEIRVERTNNASHVILNYINAGQHNPVVYLRNSRELVQLTENQRVLGVVKTNYEESTQEFSENIRLILSSDGAFEIFDGQGEILGQERFLEWIRDSAEKTAEIQKDYLMQKIESYAYDRTAFDDISILIADINLDPEKIL